MQLICKHDPSDPNHLICETKMPWKHRVLEIGIGVFALLLVVTSIVFFVKSSPVDRGRLELGTLVGEGKEGQEGVEGAEGKLDESQQYSGQSGAFLEAEALYFTKEGEQVGRGAWPPEAGEETKVKVFWKFVGAVAGGDSAIQGSSFARPPEADSLQTLPKLPHPAGNRSSLVIVIEGKLGKGMEWTGFAPQGQGLSYEPAIRTVRWVSRGGLASEPSEARPPDIAIFEVAITPNASQLQENQLLIVDNLALKYDNREILFPDIVISWD